MSRGSDSIAPVQPRKTAIAAFVRRVSLWHRAVRTLRGLTGNALVVGVLVAGISLVAPGWTLGAATVAVAWLALAGIWSLWCSGASLRKADFALGLSDRLTTWVGLRRRGRDSGAMFSWLERDLDERIAALPPEQVRRLGWRPIGVLRYALALLIVLLLLQLLRPPLPPLPTGAIQIAGAGAAGAGGAQEGGEGTGKGGPDQPAEPDSPETEDPQEQPGGQGEDEPPSPEELPPKSLLDGMPVQEEFSVPQFIGEGPSRKAMARVAEVEQGATPPTPPPPDAQGGSPDREPDADPEVEFERALERALRSRHVPEQEKPFVRRYFNALLNRAK